jgi:CheY-like chemotaxis protein
MEDVPIDLPTVVIAEDETLLRYALERTLQRECKIVASVGNGEAAVQAVDEHQPDIALLDISMPVLNGLEAAQTITEAQPAVKSSSLPAIRTPPTSKKRFAVELKVTC